MKFKEKYLAGQIPFEEIDIYIQEWGENEEPCTLREYLGLNEEEEDVWVFRQRRGADGAFGQAEEIERKHKDGEQSSKDIGEP